MSLNYLVRLTLFIKTQKYSHFIYTFLVDLKFPFIQEARLNHLIKIRWDLHWNNLLGLIDGEWCLGTGAILGDLDGIWLFFFQHDLCQACHDLYFLCHSYDNIMSKVWLDGCQKKCQNVRNSFWYPEKRISNDN